MTTLIRGKAHLLGDDINTDIHCSSKYHPGRDNAYVAQHAFEQLAPGFASRFGNGRRDRRRQEFRQQLLARAGGAHPAPDGRGGDRGARPSGGSSSATASTTACRWSNAIWPAYAEGDEIELDLAAGRVAVPARGIVREVPPLPAAVQALVAAGGLIPFLKAHPDWATP